MKSIVSVAPLLCLVLFFNACSKPEPPAEIKKEKVFIADDEDQRQKLHEEIAADLEKESFSKLESMAEEFTKTKSYFPGGDRKLKRFYEYLLAPLTYPATDSYWQNKLSKLEKWTKVYPNSIYANVALASGQESYAWHLRGPSFAIKVSEKQFADFREWAKRAQKTLDQIKNKRTDCVEWYVQEQGIGIDLGWDKPAMSKLTEEAVRIDPAYWDSHLQFVRYLMPRWYGAKGDWERYAEDASAKLAPDDGNILYSELCWEVSRYFKGTEFYQQNHVVWKRIKAGFIQREKKYGVSKRYLNAFAFMAGSAPDRATTRVLMSKIGDQWDPIVWQEKHYFDGYKKWANQN